MNQPKKSPIVSDDQDLLILVDSNDSEIGHLDKAQCHLGSGRLHRAFSIFVFNGLGELLIQQRADEKALWGNHWSNSCCSHPRIGEILDEAANRRALEELGIKLELRFVYKFEYQASYNENLSENELCSVYLGQFDGAPDPNKNEVKAWEWIASSSLTKDLQENPKKYTPWLKLEWATLLTDFRSQLPF